MGDNSPLVVDHWCIFFFVIHKESSSTKELDTFLFVVPTSMNKKEPKQDEKDQYDNCQQDQDDRSHIVVFVLCYRFPRRCH